MPMPSGRRLKKKTPVKGAKLKGAGARAAATTSESSSEHNSGGSEVNVSGTEMYTVDLDGIVSVTGRAIEVFGARDKAIHWLRTPLPSLSRGTPLSMLKTAEGIEQVEDVLGRIEQGVW